MKLFRPVGVQELALIAASEYTAFPPRLPHQPIFYPVLTYVYAEGIARNWNTEDEASGFAGFVTSFEVADEYVRRFEVHVVGGRDDRELWVPAAELPSFNRSIVGHIRIEASIYGDRFAATVDSATRLPVGMTPPPST